NSEETMLYYSGISDDIESILYQSTRIVTFQYDTELIEYSFDRSAVYDVLYQLEYNIARLKGHVLHHFTMSKNGVSSITLTKDILEKFDVNPIYTSMLVGALGDIEVIRLLVFLFEENVIIILCLHT